MTDQNFKFDTNLVHAGCDVDPNQKSIAPAIHQTVSYEFNDTSHASDLFGLKAFGNIYSRLMNPTQDALERKLASLEGGVASLVLSSGQQAITVAITNIAGTGDNIVSASALYGGTYNLFGITLPKFGIETKFVDSEDPADYQKTIDKNTKAIYLETLPNPKLSIPEIEQIAKVAHDNGIPLIVDNTAATPYLLNPIAHGADVVIHSLTKFIAGHGNTLGGVIVDSGNFDWAKSGKFPGLTEPDASYGGVKYAEAFGNLAYIIKCRVQGLRDFGGCIAPMNCFFILQGVQTLSLRVERECENALKIAQFLSENDLVESVNYPGLTSSKYYQRTQKYLRDGKGGAIVGFNLKGGLEDGKRFIENLDIFKHAVNIGDVRSYVAHPASTTHQQLTPEQRQAAGVSDNYIRLSIGIEDVSDLIDAIERALKASKV